LIIRPTQMKAGREVPVSSVYFVRPDGRCLTFVTEGEPVGWLPGTSPPPQFRCVDLVLVVSAPPSTGRRGVSYTLRMKNEGTDKASAVELTQHFGSRFRVVSLPMGCATVGVLITCRVPRLEA